MGRPCARLLRLSALGSIVIDSWMLADTKDIAIIMRTNTGLNEALYIGATALVLKLIIGLINATEDDDLCRITKLVAMPTCTIHITLSGRVFVAPARRENLNIVDLRVPRI